MARATSGDRPGGLRRVSSASTKPLPTTNCSGTPPKRANDLRPDLGDEVAHDGGPPGEPLIGGCVRGPPPRPSAIISQHPRGLLLQPIQHPARGSTLVGQRPGLSRNLHGHRAAHPQPPRDLGLLHSPRWSSRCTSAQSCAPDALHPHIDDRDARSQDRKFVRTWSVAGVQPLSGAHGTGEGALTATPQSVLEDQG